VRARPPFFANDEHYGRKLTSVGRAKWPLQIELCTQITLNPMVAFYGMTKAEKEFNDQINKGIVIGFV